jgi:hypothetical protein
VVHHQPPERPATVGYTHTVLFIVNTVASANRMLDLIPLFEGDLRVQLVFTTPPQSTATDGVAEAFAELGVLAMPWERVLERESDLAITANHSGGLHRVRAPLVVVSHGVGYSKRSAQSPEPRAQSPEPRAQSPEPRAQSPEPRAQSPVYGLSPEWLLYQGKLVASALVLSHREQLDRLAAAVPEAVGAAVVAGDPCFDRIVASEDRRLRYRRALGCDQDTTLIVFSSTWRSDSAFGSWPTFLRQLLAELPPDHYRVAAVLHPHIWHGHSPLQIRSWLADCVRAGLILIPPLEGWRAALIAADLVVGDHGAVTCYAAALGKPVALVAFDRDEVAEGSPVELLGDLATQLDDSEPLLAQLEEARTKWSDVRELVSSYPGEAAERHRALFYQRMKLAEPDTDVVEAPLPTTGLHPGDGVRAFEVTHHISTDAVVQLRRRPADVRPTWSSAPLLVVHADHPTRSLRGNADIVFCSWPDDELDILFRQSPSCLIVVSDITGTMLVRGRRSPLRMVGCDPVVAASAVCAWLATGAELPHRLSIDVDGRRYRCTLPS